MTPDTAAWVDRLRTQGDSSLLVCEYLDGAPRDEETRLWVFETAPNRLRQRWAGALARPEFDELVGRLRQRHLVWLGCVESLHPPPSRRFRLVWTLPPAPCWIYLRRGGAVHLEPTGMTRHLWRRRAHVDVSSPSVVEGWIRSDWACAGITLMRHGGEAAEIVRFEHAGLFTQFLLAYDGIDLLVDTRWLDGVVPRVADVLGVGWKIVDYTVTPPKLVQESQTAPTREPEPAA
jgi:hypothetical protein